MSGQPSSWTPRAIVTRAREVLHTEGFGPLVFKTLGELGYRRVIMFDRELPPPDGKPFPPGVRYDLLTPERFDDFLAISQLCGEAEARRRLAAGHVCQLGYVDGEPASCCWLALPGQPVAIDYLGLVAAPSPAYGYIYELYVAPKHRRTGLVFVGFQDRIRILRESGAKRVASLVMPENRAGVKHTLATGSRAVGRIHRLHFMGLQRCWTRSSIHPPPMRALRQ